MENSRELASIVSLLLLILFRQSSTSLLCPRFIQRRIRRRRVRWRSINAIIHSAYYLIARRNNYTCARPPRSVWVLPRPQMWFQQLLNDRALDHWWKENFRVSRATFDISIKIKILSLFLFAYLKVSLTIGHFILGYMKNLAIYLGKCHGGFFCYF